MWSFGSPLKIGIALIVAVAGAVAIDIVFSFRLPRIVRATKRVGNGDENEEQANDSPQAKLRLLHVNVWSGSTYEIDWGTLTFISYESRRETEKRYQTLLKRCKKLDPDVITVNEAMPCQPYVRRLANDLGMDAVYHLGVAGIVLGRFLRFPDISEGDAILAKPRLKLHPAGRARLTGSVFSDLFSLNLDDATQAVAASVALGSVGRLGLIAAHWHASLLDTEETTRDIEEHQATMAAEAATIRRSIEDHTKLRIQEAKGTLQLANSLGVSASIIAGDLNTVPGSRSIEVLRAAGYESAGGAFTWDPSRNENVDMQARVGAERSSSRGPLEKELYGRFSRRGAQLDHVLFRAWGRDEMSVERSQVVLKSNGVGDEAPSDHYGLCVDFQFSSS